MKVLVILNQGFEELEATGTIIVLKRAGYDLTLAATTKEIKGKHGINYNNLSLLKDLSYADFDLLFLPGGGYIPNEETNEAIKYFYEHNKYLAAICSGPTYFGELNLLKNKNYTCFPALNKDYLGNFKNTYVVYDKPFFTARSVASNMLLPLKIVKVLDGDEALNKLLKQMEFIDNDIIKYL